jgi:phosphoenolpyruvate carboxylase
MLSEEAQIDALQRLSGAINCDNINEGITKDTLESIQAIKFIQSTNGIASCHRYIISNCQSAVNVIELYTLFNLFSSENTFFH